jgi:hypothetical protein
MLTDEEFGKLGTSFYDSEGEREKFKNDLKDAYTTFIEILKKYCDLEERYYPVISLWIIGTYCHDAFETYPYLFLNASKGSGKSRLLRLISVLSKNGEMLNSMTEAVLFRGSKGNTICIDEFENIHSDDKSALRELLNSAYKKGTMIKRFRKKKTPEGEKYEAEIFDVYTSIAMANISGMERVLADRCISLILEKSFNKKITRLIEDFSDDFAIIEIKKRLEKVEQGLANLIKDSHLGKDWNHHVLGGEKIFFAENKNNEKGRDIESFFEMIDDTEIEGRNLELLLPLYFLAYQINDEKDALKTILKISKEIVIEKEAEESLENNDRVLIKFLAEKLKQNLEYTSYISVAKITSQFKEYLGDGNDWINSGWMGKALKRNKIIKEKKRESNGIKILIDLDSKKLNTIYQS